MAKILLQFYVKYTQFFNSKDDQDVFCQKSLSLSPLRLTIKKWQQEGKVEERDITEDVELHASLRQLGSETILSLIIYMSKISVHVEGKCPILSS